ncbi:zinc transporter ZupT [Pseudodesulfovibrio thermohalotolerans]|jgi:ZIP family zinc transporter|uniref:zinc transporter ZupT n=1 Tax=Pseudodesulfovibrio thermohalotolerans TaxID=2880651 RepID=UPI002441C1A1|nr:zinc transporter ZupT [Pseudodesulfovibrio thermohalotolerans]WFS62701.1 zinc transporter ZupT [Pseudodesulfovibrio thermohalotolerans]
MDTQTIVYAFGLTLFAGLSTGIGSAIAFFARRTNTKFLSLALGFSAGVMIYVSFVEILVKARDALATELGDVSAAWVTALSFFGGIAFIALIDNFVPSYENPHEMHSIEEMEEGLENLPRNEAHDFDRLKRTGVFAAVAIAIHNFPEGLATFTAALTDPALGLAIAVAIAIHNIPEGIAVSIPLYYATGDRRKAFFYSFLSGLSEPVGALIGYLVLLPFFTPVVFGVLFAGVAGIMVFISLDELLPAAEEFGEHHHSIYGLVGGMAVMALSLLLFL